MKVSLYDQFGSQSKDLTGNQSMVNENRDINQNQGLRGTRGTLNHDRTVHETRPIFSISQVPGRTVDWS
jgi:hypothetical protein